MTARPNCDKRTLAPGINWSRQKSVTVRSDYSIINRGRQREERARGYFKRGDEDTMWLELRYKLTTVACLSCLFGRLNFFTRP
jgi:hypothetical protein